MHATIIINQVLYYVSVVLFDRELHCQGRSVCCVSSCIWCLFLGSKCALVKVILENINSLSCMEDVDFLSVLIKKRIWFVFVFTAQNWEYIVGNQLLIRRFNPQNWLDSLVPRCDGPWCLNSLEENFGRRQKTCALCLLFHKYSSSDEGLPSWAH